MLVCRKLNRDIARDLFAYSLCWLLVLLAAPSRAQTTSPQDFEIIGAVEIVGVEVSGGTLEVTIATAPGVDPESWFELLFSSSTGVTVESVTFQPELAGNAQVLVLNGDFTHLGARGWQHQLEIVDALGQSVEQLPVRLSLECPGKWKPCRIVAEPGLRIEDAVEVSSALAPFLTSGLTSGQAVDLAALVASEPSLKAAIFETAIDLEARYAAPPTSCQCFYSVDDPRSGGTAHVVAQAELDPYATQPSINLLYFSNLLFMDQHRLEAERATERRLGLDFHCFQMDAITAAQITITGGTLSANLPTLQPCPSQCASPVRWSLVDFGWTAILGSEGSSSAAGAFELTWRIDQAEAFSDGLSWSMHGTPINGPRTYSALIPEPTPSFTVLQTPTSSSYDAIAWAQIRNWSLYDLPLVQVTAQATLQAEGLATCAPPAVIQALPWVWAAGLTPSTIVVVLGPDDETP